MLTRELVAIIECVRALEMKIVTRDDKEFIKVAGATTEFPERLVTLQRALEAFDKANGAGTTSLVYKPPAKKSLSIKAAQAHENLNQYRHQAMKKARARIEMEQIEDARDPGMSM